MTIQFGPYSETQFTKTYMYVVLITMLMTYLLLLPVDIIYYYNCHYRNNLIGQILMQRCERSVTSKYLFWLHQHRMGGKTGFPNNCLLDFYLIYRASLVSLHSKTLSHSHSYTHHCSTILQCQRCFPHLGPHRYNETNVHCNS